MTNFRTLLASTILVAAASVSAQAEENRLLTVTVPFAFTVANTNLPAGTYTLYSQSPQNLVRLQSADFRKSAYFHVVRVTGGEISNNPKLVFRRIGGQAFLAQVWEGKSGLHRDPATGSLARELAKAGNRGEETMVAEGSGSR